jgi:hypothetical protein
MIRWIRILIWAYLVLLIGEGALRKWVFFSLADPLLIVRDPVLLGIYVLALAAGVFPKNGFVITAGVLAVLSTVAALLAGNGNALVIAYGLRINFLHLLLIWIAGSVLTRGDVRRMGGFLLLTAIPMTLVMVQQFRSPISATINRGIGGDTMGQIFGADGRIRPPGLFAFITGPQLFYPLCAAFFLHQLSSGRRLPWYVLMPCGIAIALALPVSISRTVMLATAVVGVAFVVSLPLVVTHSGKVVRPLLLLAALALVLTRLPIFAEGSSVFMMRWDTAAQASEGDAWGGVMERTVNGFTNPFYFFRIAPFFGYGIGMGSNVAARLLSGGMGFMLAEEEWGKVLLELGPILGTAFIVLRIAIVGHLGVVSWRALRESRDSLPLLIFSASALSFMQGQWGPPTVLGFAVISAGLILAAAQPAEEGPSKKLPAAEPRREHRPISRSIARSVRRQPALARAPRS